MYAIRSYYGAVGASYGGYSVFYLAGVHNNRFKTFISHCGVFNLESMYGTTEEVFFTNWDLGGPYWDKNNTAAQKTYQQFNPIKLVDKWNTPIFVIQGGKDFRVPIGQGQEAFQAAQLKGIHSRFMFFPDVITSYSIHYTKLYEENHGEQALDHKSSRRQRRAV